MSVVVLLALPNLRCSSSTDGIEVEVAFAPRYLRTRFPIEAVEEGEMPTAEAHYDRLLVGLKAIVLEPCGASTVAAAPSWTERRGALAEAMDAIGALLAMPVALAHSGSEHDTDDAIDVVHSSAFLLPGGVVTPAPGTYCGIRLRLGPTDDGTVLDLAAVHYAEDGTETPFALRREIAEEKVVPLSEPMTFDADTRMGAIVVRFDAERWLEGIDPAAPEGARVVENMWASVEAEVWAAP